MKKISDFFAAGVLIGAVGSMITNLFPLGQLLLGIPTRTPWGDLAALFFRPPEVFSIWAQLFGVIATFGVGAVNGITIGFLLKFTGRDFAYLKSAVVCSATVMLAFMILYPALGLKANQHSIVTTYSALLNNQLFALTAAYLFLRFTTVGEKEAEPQAKKKSEAPPKLKYRFVPSPVSKPEQKEMRIRFLRPKKIKTN